MQSFPVNTSERLTESVASCIRERCVTSIEIPALNMKQSLHIFIIRISRKFYIDSAPSSWSELSF